MSLKTLAKTSWKIEPNRVIIYPSGVFYIFVTIISLLELVCFIYICITKMPLLWNHCLS